MTVFIYDIVERRRVIGMDNEILQAIEGLRNEFEKFNTSADKVDSVSDMFDLLGSQIEENTQILNRLLLLAEDSKEAHAKMISDITEVRSELKQKRSRIKVKTKVTPRMQTGGSSHSKKIIVNVDYDPKTDFALIAFKRKMKSIWNVF